MCIASFNFNLNGVEMELIILKQFSVLTTLQFSLLTRRAKMWDFFSVSKCSLIFFVKWWVVSPNITGITAWTTSPWKRNELLLIIKLQCNKVWTRKRGKTYVTNPIAAFLCVCENWNEKLISIIVRWTSKNEVWLLTWFSNVNLMLECFVFKNSKNVSTSDSRLKIHIILSIYLL